MLTITLMATIAIIFWILLEANYKKSENDISPRVLAMFIGMSAYIIWCLCWAVYTIIVWAACLAGCTP